MQRMPQPLRPEDLHKPVTAFMRPVEVTIHIQQNVGEAIEAIRRAKPTARILYVYVVNGEDRLVGVVSTRALLLNEPDKCVSKVMDTALVTVPSSATLDLAIDLFALHRLLALPVVDDDTGYFRGVLDVQVYAEEMLDLAEARRGTDVFQLIGLSAEQLREARPVRLVRARLPWLGFNLVSGLICAFIGAVFTETLQSAIVLAMFIPLVLTLSESTAVQSVSDGLATMQTPGVRWKLAWRRLKKEWVVSSLVGVSLALAVGLIALLWRSGWHAPGVIAVATGASILLAATIGKLVPTVLHALKLDPKLAAGPVSLAFTDVVTMMVYLSLGALLL
jgi:magnesium transporter